MKCSFCNKEIEEGKQYIVGGLGDICMCDDCIKNLQYVYTNIMDKSNNTSNTTNPTLTPSQIKAELDKYIIGQDDAKKTMAIAIYNHYIRISQNETGNGVDIQKSNILLLGPTGTGKCVCGDTKVKIRNKKTGKVIYDTINNIYNKYGFR